MTVWAILMGTVASSVYIDTGPPPTAETHRHWRLKGTAAGTFDGGALAEIEFYDTVGGASIATGGTPSAGSEAFGGLATNAFDGLPEFSGGMWAGAGGAIVAGTSWVAYDFGTPVTVAEFGIMPRSGGNADQMWNGWDLEYSDDGTTWVTHSSYEDLTAWTADVIRRFELPPPPPPPAAYPEILTPFITARYWKLDNFVYVNTLPTVNGLSLCTINNVGSVYHAPTAINTNIGLNADLDRNRVINGDGVFNNSMSSITEVLFEYPVAIAPSHLAIYADEWDRDYIGSCDISFSLDGVDWFLCGRYDIDDPATQYGRIGFSDDHEVYFPVIGSPTTKLSVSEASAKVVIGQAGSGVSVQRARILLPLGRNNEALTVHDARLWVITTPA